MLIGFNVDRLIGLNVDNIFNI